MERSSHGAKGRGGPDPAEPPSGGRDPRAVEGLTLRVDSAPDGKHNDRQGTAVPAVGDCGALNQGQLGRKAGLEDIGGGRDRAWGSLDVEGGVRRGRCQGDGGNRHRGDQGIKLEGVLAIV